MSLERLWREAALAGVDPAVAELRPAASWGDAAALPSDALQDRIARLFDCHRLAIALGDLDWLRELDVTWRGTPVSMDALRVLRARGEIGLGLGTGGWTPDELELLVEESFLVPGVPTEDAWRALAIRDPGAARRALARAEAARPAEASPMLWPGVVLGVELRALRALLEALIAS